MKKYFLIMNLTFFVVSLYSQTDNEIIHNAINCYNNNLYKLERKSYRLYKKFDKTSKTKRGKYKKYQFMIFPTFDLKDNYTKYYDSDKFIRYINFNKISPTIEVIVLKDSIYLGLLHFYQFKNLRSFLIGTFYHNKSLKGFWSINDTIKFKNSIVNDNYYRSKQIITFKPDMSFYLPYQIFCFIKENELYIGVEERNKKAFKTIMPFDEYVKQNPTFKNELMQSFDK